METTSRTCRWVRRRLSLLAGDELAGIERRRVEDHLRSCAACREERVAATRSVTLLREVGTSTRLPVAEEAPALWPRLSRRIDEAGHQARFSRGRGRIAVLALSRFRRGGWAGLAVAAGLALVAGLLLARPGTVQTAAPSATTASHTPPPASPTAEAPGAPITGSTEAEDAPLVLVPTKRRPSALPDGQPAPADRGVDPFLPPRSSWVGFDLDRGTLINPANPDTQRAY